MENIARRKVLMGAAAITAAALIKVDAMAEEHQHHHHHEIVLNNDLINAALHCVQKGEACQNHCIELVKQGDTTIAECLDAVSVMIPMCETLTKMASFQSKHLNAYAKVCIEVCKDCKAACEEHAKMHAECKACMESCAACIKECEKLAA
jgi:Cys-rich four helix bundle protein (predicted Tat secretion target)